MLSCSGNTERQAIEKTISDFPFFKPQKNGQYLLRRKIDTRDVTVSLFESNDGERKEIITIGNKNGVVSIPLLSNNYRDYWSFPNDKNLSDFPKIKTTFEAEYLNGIKHLNLYNKEDFIAVNEEIFLNLLHCVRYTDTLALYNKINDSYITFVDPKNSYDCLKRTQSNFQLISKDAKNNFKGCDYYYDLNRRRIHRVEIKDDGDDHSAFYVSFLSLRQDCVTD